MKFKHGTRRRALEYEKDWVQRWKENRTFEKSVEGRPADDSYVFYDGPPFITGVPHHGTLLSSIVKDAVPRYWTMKGKRVERVWGWDCHGLPAENFVEKQLNITDRRQIVTTTDAKPPLDKDGNELPTISLEKYITKARESMVANSESWESYIDRIGRWVDFKGAYRTMDKNFMESVWWAFKELYEAGKIYEGEKVLMYDTRFATPVSKAEVTMDNDAYQTVTDPSLYAKFKLKNGSQSRSDITLNEESKVLFVCCESIGRSQMGRAVYNKLTNSTNAVSAATGFGKEFRTGTIADLEKMRSEKLGTTYESTAKRAILDKLGVDISDVPRTQLSPDMLEDYDLVVNMAEKWQTPDWLRGENVIWWDVKDPGMVEDYDGRLAASCNALDDIEKRVVELIDGKLVDDDVDASYVLAWTTTPWTLPANLMLAVSAELTYCEVLVDGEKLIVAEEALERVMKDEKNKPLEYEVVRKFPGSELVGKSYEPLDTGSLWPENDAVHKIYAADFVSHESGTGIVHCAPAYGEDDFELAKANGIAAFHVIDDNGYYVDTNYKGLEVWENNKRIAKDLMEKSIAWRIEYIRHEYPFNPRSKQRIMYRAIPSWFFDVQGQKPLMLEQNENISWFPEHLKHGRFQKNIEQAPDWNLSRDRFWATAMPVWKGDKGTVKVVGSYAELKELSGVELEDYHRPWVDDITFEVDGEKFTRIDKVLDCWFESGSMPFAQLHYPFENQEKFEKNYPADFIVEYVGQVRAWFYYVHAVNTSLAEIGAFGADSKKSKKNAYDNVIVTGNLMGEDGTKLSKSKGNFTDPNQLMDATSADSLRFALLASPVMKGEDFAIRDKDVTDVARKLSMVWNMYDFFTMYAEVDGWEFDASKPFALNPDDLTNPLDKWIVSRVHQLNEIVTENMDAYDIPSAMEPILPLLDDASNWYVRRSRRRFWKSEDDGDKNDAYRTLHYVLLKLSVILAPFTPFLAEELYHNLTGDEESVHLKDWATDYTADQAVLADMSRTRDLINAGLGLRMKKDENQDSIKVRQPLQFASYAGEKLDEYYERIIAEELNVKEVRHIENLPEYLAEYDTTSGAIDETTWVEVCKEITPELRREGLMREVIRHVQSARKQAGLNVDDRIVLGLASEDGELMDSLDEFQKAIAEETLTDRYVNVQDGYSTTAKVEGAELRISLKKA